MNHPYHHVPDHCFWNKTVADRAWQQVEFKPNSPFFLTPTDRIATGGSCFARHIGRHLQRTQRNIFITEKAPAIISATRAVALTYGHFSARYGNIYTTTQLRQLVEQAFALRPPIFDLCEEKGRWFDLLRPRVQPGGFFCREEAEADRRYHLLCVEQLFRQADCFIFTLGLTEYWQERHSGVVYPACPGTVVGAFSAERYCFVNQDYPAALADLSFLIDFVRTINPGLRWILTVSPVHLIATAEAGESVITASTYSKSVLRAVAGALARRDPRVDYFPAFEIISSAANRGLYLTSDLRDANPAGVDHVMQCFDRTYFPAQTSAQIAHEPPPNGASPSPVALASAADLTGPIRQALEQECEEMFNDPWFRPKGKNPPASQL